MEGSTTNSDDQQANDTRNNNYAGSNQSVHYDLTTDGMSGQPLSYRHLHQHGSTSNHNDISNNASQHMDLTTNGISDQSVTFQHQYGSESLDSTRNKISSDSTYSNTPGNNYHHGDDDDQPHGAAANHIGARNICMVFVNFLGPELDPFLLVSGELLTLNLLQRSLQSGIQAQRFEQHPEVSPFTPVTTALNAVCAELRLPLVTEYILYKLALEPWFAVLKKLYIKKHRIEGELIINDLRAGCVLDVDSNFLLSKAFQVFYALSDLDLGIVIIDNDTTIRAFRYHQTNPQDVPTAWMVAEGQSDSIVFHGIGQLPQQQVETVASEVRGESESENGENSPATVSTSSSTPRKGKTAARIQALQVSLDTGLSAHDILHDYPGRLHYNNMLKVALTESNNDIYGVIRLFGSEKIHSATVVVKRIGVALDLLEEKFGITKNALRVAFDSARRANGVNVRPKEEVDGTIANANSSLIDAVMDWIRQGGPMSANLAAVASGVAGPTTTSGAVSPALHGGAVIGATPSLAAHPGAQRPPPAARSVSPHMAAFSRYGKDTAAESAALQMFLPDPNRDNRRLMGKNSNSGRSRINLTSAAATLELPDHERVPLSAFSDELPAGDAVASSTPLGHQRSLVTTSNGSDVQMINDNALAPGKAPFGFRNPDGTGNQKLPVRHAEMFPFNNGPNGEFDWDKYYDMLEDLKYNR